MNELDNIYFLQITHIHLYKILHLQQRCPSHQLPDFFMSVNIAVHW